MDRTTVAGIALTAFSAIGYVVGVAAAYPGRAFSVSGVMVGITLLAIGGDDGR
jgi:hypothetical protein